MNRLFIDTTALAAQAMRAAIFAMIRSEQNHRIGSDFWFGFQGIQHATDLLVNVLL